MDYTTKKIESVEKIASAVDRLQEVHFHLHNMERSYHVADHFRWFLNCFLRALKEIPKLLQMELQGEPGFKQWYEGKRTELIADPLIGYLSKARDIVVHRKMLLPKSNGFVGVTEGRGLKIGFSLPIHPMDNSDTAMARVLRVIKEKGDGLELLREDEESLPCIERAWRLEEFEEELTDLAARAWLRVGEVISAAIAWLGCEPPDLSLTCRHSSQRFQLKVYEREHLRRWMGEM